MKISGIEFVQSAHDGGFHLDNKTASKHGWCHGTPLRLIRARDLDDLISTVKALEDFIDYTEKEAVDLTEGQAALWDNICEAYIRLTGKE